MAEENGFTYKKAGVDVEAGNRAVELMKERLKSTQNPLVLGGLGGFGGAMRLPHLKDPVLVAGTDGVGTKIEIARRLERLDTIGIDLVAMSVNDVSACGAVPLFFLDYLVVGKVVPEEVADIVAGVDEGCVRAQCVLLGGETAEHPGQFPDGDFDLAGFAVGIAERDALWGPQLVRRATSSSASTPQGCTATASVSSVTSSRNTRSTSRATSSARAVASGCASRRVTATARATTRGPRSATCCSRPPPSTARCCTILGTPAACTRRRTSPAAASPTTSGAPCRTISPPSSTSRAGRRVRSSAGCTVSASHRPELLKTFNCGLGMVLAVDAAHAEKNLAVIEKGNFAARVVGTVVRRDGGDAVRYVGELRV